MATEKIEIRKDDAIITYRWVLICPAERMMVMARDLCGAEEYMDRCTCTGPCYPALAMCEQDVVGGETRPVTDWQGKMVWETVSEKSAPALAEAVSEGWPLSVEE